MSDTSSRYLRQTPLCKAAICAGQTYRFVHVYYPGAPRILIVAMIALVYSRNQCWE